MVLLSQRASATHDDGCVLCAKSGWPIPRENPEEYTNVDAATLSFKNAHLTERFVTRLGVQIRSQASVDYNCVGMVFASRRFWIEDEHIKTILDEDSYRRIAREQVVLGDVAIYAFRGERVHVGVVVEILQELGRRTSRFKVMSKWGLLPEFIHFEGAVPEQFEKVSEFYTDRLL